MSAESLGNVRDYTTSDTSNDNISWVLVNVSGSLVLEQQFGAVNTLLSVPAGVWLPVGNTIRITTASTATGIMVI